MSQKSVRSVTAHHVAAAPAGVAGRLCILLSLLVFWGVCVSSEVEPVVCEVVAAWADRPGGLLPALREAQLQLGYVPAEAVQVFADGFNISRAEVHGVLSFYHDFRTTPPPPTTIRLCRAEACQAVGAESVARALEAACGTTFGAEDASVVALETVYCFGNCAVGPTAEVNGRLVAQADAERLLSLAEVN